MKHMLHRAAQATSFITASVITASFITASFTLAGPAAAQDDHPAAKYKFDLPPSAELTYTVKASSHGTPKNSCVTHAPITLKIGTPT